MREILTEHGKAAKTYLSAYRRTERGIAVRLRELERLRTLSEQVRSAVKPGMRADSLGRIQALEAEAADGVSRLCALRQEIEQAIGEVEDDTLREILDRHYVQMQTLNQIAVELHYTPRHVSRLHKQALEHVCVRPGQPVSV